MADEKTKVNKREKLGNCGGCNKPIKKIRRYYRNGKYFCTKRCYNTMLEKAKQQKENA